MAEAKDKHPAAAAIQAALAPVRRLKASPEKTALESALRAAADLVQRPDDAATRAALEHARRGSQQALLLTTGGGADLDLAEAVAAAINACLRAAERIPEVDKLYDPDSLLEGTAITSTRDRPALLTPRRDRFVRPEGAPVPARSADAEDDESDAAEAAESDAPEEEARADDDLMAREMPAITVNREVGKPVGIAAYYAEITAACADTAALLARQRANLASSERPGYEARILELADAAAITGTDCVARNLAWWEESHDSPDPWKSWAGAYFLATLGGADALQAVALGLERLPVDAIDQGILAAEALSISPHPAIGALARDLVCSPHPVARAVGVDLLARLRLLGIEDLQRHLADSNVPVLAAACRAVADLDRKEADPIIPILQRWLWFPHRAVAWPAARALLLFGHRDPYADLKASDRLIRVLGPLAAEIVVMAGDPSDMPRLQAILGRVPPGRETLSALARFGHPAAWAYLLHHLENPDRAEAASAALRTLFGPCVEEDDEESPAAWRAAITSKAIEPGVRYRAGEPWSPRVVADECASGHLSRHEIEKRIDELAVRAGLRTRVDLRLFCPDFAPALAQWRAEAAKSSAAHRAGTW